MARGRKETANKRAWMMGTGNDSIEIKEKRKGNRVKYEIPDFVYAEFSLRRKDPKKDKSYVLKVMDWSRNGLGMVVTQKDFDLLYQVKVGDILQNMAFFMFHGRY
jgi:hypothetical protein